MSAHRSTLHQNFVSLGDEVSVCRDRYAARILGAVVACEQGNRLLAKIGLQEFVDLVLNVLKRRANRRLGLLDFLLNLCRLLNLRYGLDRLRSLAARDVCLEDLGAIDDFFGALVGIARLDSRA